MHKAAPHPLGAMRTRDGIETYEAGSTNGERLFVKRLASASDADPLPRRRFAREKRLAQTLSHPALAGLRGIGIDWFACEYLEEGLDRPQTASLYRSEAAIATLIGALAALLCHLHGLGIAHGDIKPAHIRFRGQQPVLVDFGIAAIGEDDALTGCEILGTPRWMAPEQMRAGTITPAADIWSLCSVGLWLLEGRLPLIGSAQDVLAKRDAGIQHEFDLEAIKEQSPPAGETDRLGALLIGGLEPDPRRRLTAIMLASAIAHLR